MEEEKVVKQYMEAGELEMRKVFEEVTTRNVQAAIDFSNDTRKIVRELEQKMKHMEDMIQAKDKVISEMKSQIAWLQQQVYKGGI